MISQRVLGKGNEVDGKYALFILLLFVCGCPSLVTNRICLGGGAGVSFLEGPDDGTDVGTALTLMLRGISRQWPWNCGHSGSAAWYWGESEYSLPPGHPLSDGGVS
jgi:hypothetical protein